MIIRGLSGDHDFLLGKGKQSYLYQNNAIAENIQTRLLAILRDCYFDLEAGIDWFRLLGQKSTEQEILANIRSVILNSYGVVQINTVAIQYIDTRSIRITYDIDTIFSQRFNQNIEVVNA